MNLEEIVRIAGGPADRERRDRRERIATAAMQGLLASGRYYQKVNVAQEAVEYADALIAELDKKEGGA